MYGVHARCVMYVCLARPAVSTVHSTAYEEAMQGVRNKLLGHSTGRLQLTFIGEVLTR
jgi:hypothetical protein